MKKTYFLRTWPATIQVAIWSIVLLGVAQVIKLAGYLFNSYTNIAFQQLGAWLTTVANGLMVMYYGVSICLVVNFIIIVVTHDTVENFMWSVKETHELHRFSHQSEGTINIPSFGDQQIVTATHTNRTFNRAVKFSAVDIRKNRALVFILVPPTQQAQKVLKNMDKDLKEQMANRLPEFSFSQPVRVKNGLWIEGTRKRY